MDLPSPEKIGIESGPKSPETGAETPESGGAFETPKPAPEAAMETAPATSLASDVARPGAPAKDETVKGVEDVLEEGLADTYQHMTPKARARFKKEGERVTSELVRMVRSLKIKAGKVLDLIRKWLSMIPGVNRYFLAQEAKIKTDRIMALAEEEKKKRGGI